MLLFLHVRGDSNGAAGYKKTGNALGPHHYITAHRLCRASLSLISTASHLLLTPRQQLHHAIDSRPSPDHQGHRAHSRRAWQHHHHPLLPEHAAREPGPQQHLQQHPSGHRPPAASPGHVSLRLRLQHRRPRRPEPRRRAHLPEARLALHPPRALRHRRHLSARRHEGNPRRRSDPRDPRRLGRGLLAAGQPHDRQGGRPVQARRRLDRLARLPHRPQGQRVV
ncbi:hypothetical protein MPH_09623 [Macrophomina phaseolina MS6]|uniref:Uncharacterized protein n=1 Tax=Macrophomina phaseolina (strain MS6) TaxID=1126212 RepID=K2QU90_MACPH|nr:hypothetical protein MPH_09623 [Macrophomina phaseolina MS6]